MILLDRSQDGYLASRHIRDEKPVLALALHRVPQAVTDQQPLAVFGEAHIGRQRHHRWLAGDNCIQVTLNEPFQAGSIATRLCGRCRGNSRQRQCASNHNRTKQTRIHVSPFNQVLYGSYQAWSPPSLFRNLPVSLMVTLSITFMSLPTATGVGISPGMFCPWKLSTSTPPG